MKEKSIKKLMETISMHRFAFDPKLLKITCEHDLISDGLIFRADYRTGDKLFVVCWQ